MTILSHQRPGARLLVPKGPPAGSATRPRGSVPWPEALAAVPSEEPVAFVTARSRRCGEFWKFGVRSEEPGRRSVFSWI